LHHFYSHKLTSKARVEEKDLKKLLNFLKEVEVFHTNATKALETIVEKNLTKEQKLKRIPDNSYNEDIPTVT
jgi:hypothetical protein